MYKFKHYLVCLLFFTLGLGSASADYSIVLQSGHDGPPAAIEKHTRTNTIVSAGKDGRLIAFEPGKSRVTHRFHVSTDQIINLRLNPVSPQAALIINKAGEYSLEVWDWTKEKKQYSYQLDSEPLFLRWSAKGRYLIMGSLGTPSVVVLEGRSGRRLSYLQRLPSLYNDAYIGSTEAIVMTYSSSGTIQYRDIRSSALKLEVETLSSLNNLTVLQTGDKSTLFATSRNSMYLIHRQTGELLDQIEIPGIADISVDAANGDIAVLSNTGSGKTLWQFNASSQRFLPCTPFETEAAPVFLDDYLNPVQVLRDGGATFLMSENGILYHGTGGSGVPFQPVLTNSAWVPDSLTFLNDSVYLSGPGLIRKISSPFFKETSRGSFNSLLNSPLEFAERRTGTAGKITGISALKDNRLLLWTEDNPFPEESIKLFRFDEPSETGIPAPGPLADLTVLDNSRILTLTRSGNVSLINIDTENEEFTYSALGILDAALSTPESLLTARSSAGSTGSPLELVDLQTRESIPIPDKRFMVYNVTASSEGIYTIGVDRTGKKPLTILKKHNKANPEQSRALIQIKGEYLNAQILPHPEGKGFFASVGSDIIAFSGSRSTRFDSEARIKTLACRGATLYGIDGNGAVILWNAKNGKVLVKFHMFQDGNWLALSGDNKKIWYSSPDILKNVQLYKDGTRVRRLN